MAKHSRPKTPTDAKGQIRRTANLAHEASYLSKPCPTPGQKDKRPRNFNKRLMAHAAGSASAKRKNVYFYEQKKC